MCWKQNRIRWILEHLPKWEKWMLSNSSRRIRKKAKRCSHNSNNYFPLISHFIDNLPHSINFPWIAFTYQNNPPFTISPLLHIPYEPSISIPSYHLSREHQLKKKKFNLNVYFSECMSLGGETSMKNGKCSDWSVYFPIFLESEIRSPLSSSAQRQFNTQYVNSSIRQSIRPEVQWDVH